MRDHVVAALRDVYEVGEELGRGGMALVYRATDIRLRRLVAIKVLPPELAFRDEVRRRFLREAQTAAQLNHPNIIPIYSVDERGGLVFFVMAYVEGASLAARLARGPLVLEEARRILCDVADALAYAHARGVVHRDIKPDNILLEHATGRPLVTDFGIARAAEADGHLTATGIAVGTPAYMSPEQALGDRELDGRSDIYSLGVVAYQILSGELPHRANNTPAMMMKHISEVPRPLKALRPDVPPALAAAVERALAKRPEERWGSANAFRDAIEGRAWEEAGSRKQEAGGIADASRESRVARELPRERDLDRETGYSPLATRDSRPPSRRQRRHRDDHDRFDERPIEERITIFRRNLASTGFVIGMLAAINFITTPWFPWFVFAALGMGASVVRQWSSLWAEGVTWKRIFRREEQPLEQPLEQGGAKVARGAGVAPFPAARPSAIDEVAAKLVPQEVLAGPHAGAVRRAVSDRITIRDIVSSLAQPDRELLPDVTSTVDALVDRTASLARMLHHLDTDVPADALARLESRIAAVKAEPEGTADHERRLSLLERQQVSLRELAERRERLSGQLESAGIALQNIKLDLLKLRASGVQAAIAEVTSATVEARALSREIGHVLEAADEVRRIT
jgi:serine/threonine-protein kinase